MAKAIIVDTRETQPFDFGSHPTLVRKLDVGDYAIQLPRARKAIVERKSVRDMACSLTVDWGRFCRSIARGIKEYRYSIVVEGARWQVQQEVARRSNTPALVVDKRLARIQGAWQVPVYLCDSREDAAKQTRHDKTT